MDDEREALKSVLAHFKVLLPLPNDIGVPVPGIALIQPLPEKLVPPQLSCIVPVIFGNPALFIVPAVLLPSTNLSIRFGSANVVLPSPAP